MVEVRRRIFYFLFASDKEYKKVFPNVSVVGFHNRKSRKDYVLKAALPETNKAGDMNLVRKKSV